jgi:hypothetical protein
VPCVSESAKRGKWGFPGPRRSFIVRPANAAGREQNNQTNTFAKEDTMNTEIIELNAVEGEIKAEEAFQLLDLSVDDLDFVGGGAVIGSLL